MTTVLSNFLWGLLCLFKIHKTELALNLPQPLLGSRMDVGGLCREEDARARGGKAGVYQEKMGRDIPSSSTEMRENRTLPGVIGLLDVRYEGESDGK